MLREMRSHVEFVFHYRITEFMRLIADGVDVMEANSIRDVAAWMMKKISECGCSFSARFSVNEEDDVEVDIITVDFLFELLCSCKKRQVERVDFEVSGEPRSVCWRRHSFTEEKALCSGESEYQHFEATTSELDFDDDFIDFLKKLEQRQEMIKESALCLLSPLPGVLAEQCRIEKSVQTTPITLSAEVFVPELPSPDLAEFHNARLGIGCVDNFVDSSFDLDQKVGTSHALKRVTTPRFLSPRKIDRNNRTDSKCWGKSTKKTTAHLRSIQRISSLSETECPSRIEDVVTLHNTAAVAHRMQKKWERMHPEDRLSMTAALSTGVVGVEESLYSTRTGRKNKKNRNDEWIVGLLRMLEQKPAKSRKLLKGLVNISKQQKVSKSFKSRSCDGISISSKSSESGKQGKNMFENRGPSMSEGPQHSVDVYTYIKRKLKEHEKKVMVQCDVEAEPKKLEKERNQEDIRAYLVGRKVIGRFCKRCGAQKDARDFFVEKKTKESHNVENMLSTLTISSDREQQSKSLKSKSSSKQRINGKYFKLTSSPMLAVVGESSVNYFGRLPKNEAVYGKTFKMINLCRKEVQFDIVPINWPDYIDLLHPTSPTTLGPGENKNIAVTIKRSSAIVVSECHLLSIVSGNSSISHTLSFTIDACSTQHEGPLLLDVHAEESVEAVIARRQNPSLTHSINKEEAISDQNSLAADTKDTVQSVVNMLKEQVDSLCSAVFQHQEDEKYIVDTTVGNYSTNNSSIPVDTIENEQLLDSIHTAVEDDCNQCSNKQLSDSVHTAVEVDYDQCSVSSYFLTQDDEKDVLLSVSGENPVIDDSSVSDFEFVDIDVLETMLSDKRDDKFNV